MSDGRQRQERSLRLALDGAHDAVRRDVAGLTGLERGGVGRGFQRAGARGALDGDGRVEDAGEVRGCHQQQQQDGQDQDELDGGLTARPM